MCSEELVKELQPLYHTSHRVRRWLCYGGGSGDFVSCKVGDLHQVKGKLNLTGYHSILQHHTIPSGTQHVGQGFVLMQDNDTKHTSKLYQRYIKSKEEQHILQLLS